MDWERVSRELVRAVRGKRSQVPFSRRLGYRTNVLYKWESGTDFPTAARFFEAARRANIDLEDALHRYFRGRPPPCGDLAKREGVVALLAAVRGRTPIVDVARRTGFTRFAVARWFNGETQPRLPQFLAVFEVCTLSTLDFLASLVDPEQLPSIWPTYRDLEATRRAAHDAPWTHAVLRGLELADYVALDAHDEAFLARRLDLPAEEVARCLALLEASGQVTRRDERYEPARVIPVDTRRDPASTRALRSFWLKVAQQYLDKERPGVFSYNVFGVSEADLERLRELHATYYQQMRAIIAESEPVERVVVASAQLFPLGGLDAKT